MKRKIFSLLLLIGLMFALCACSNSASNPVESQTDQTSAETEAVSPSEEETREAMTEETDISVIDRFFDRCSDLCDQHDKPMRFSSDAWGEESLDDGQTQYTLLGSSLTLSFIYDSALDRIVKVSSSLSVENYADEEQRADMIFFTAVLSTAMSGEEDSAAADYCTDIENMISSGIEVYHGSVRLSLSASPKEIAFSAEIQNE